MTTMEYLNIRLIADSSKEQSREHLMKRGQAMSNKKSICIALSPDILEWIDSMALINKRSRSSMIELFLGEEKEYYSQEEEEHGQEENATRLS